MLLLPKFDYEKPSSLDRALALLLESGRGPKVFAGGTDLLVQMKEGLFDSGLLVDIKGIAALSAIAVAGDGSLTLGATVTMSQLVQWIRESPGWWSGLAGCADAVGSHQIRNRATVVGNICRASPSADTAPGLIALDAAVSIVGRAGSHSMPVCEFIKGPGQTVLLPEEMVVSLSLPKPCGPTSLVYVKHGIRRAMDLAAVSVAVRLTTGAGEKTVHDARIVLGAVAPTPFRLVEGEALVVQEGMGPQVLEEIGRLAKAASRPISDVRASADYRSELTQVLTRRALAAAWNEVGQGMTNG